VWGSWSPNSTSESSEFDNRLTTIDDRTAAIQGNSKTRTGRLCSNISTSGHRIENHDNNQLCGEAPHCIELSISFPFYFIIFRFPLRKKMNN
jgi:hypothetical protein